MKKTLKIINELKKKGWIEDYALGGGIAAIFYVEPFLTYDLDVFIILSKKEKKRNLILLSPIFNYLEDQGFCWIGEHIIIEGMPVQFIPADKLEEEAIRKAKQISYEKINTKVMTPEYLISILLRAGRKKDLEKIEKLLQQAEVDMKKLKNILSKYGLSDKIKLL
jgi:hypothetical protein